MSEQELERLRAGLRELARDGERSQFPEHLEGILCDRFRQFHRGRRIRQGILIAGIAACLTIVFAGGTVMLRRSLSTPERVSESRPPATAPAMRVPEPQREIAAEATPPVSMHPAPARARRRRAPEPAVQEQVMTGFLPVGLGATFGPGERGSLVRVRLPRSALASFGLPVNENRAADVVNADVLLGEDGLARAIRFVQ